MTDPDGVRIVMLTRAELQTPDPLRRLLLALESVVALVPTHWGPDERARNVYSREQMLDAVKGADAPLVLGLRRAKPPRYAAHIAIGDPHVRMFRLDIQSGLSPKNLRLAFDLGDALALASHPDFGLVHLIWSNAEGGDDYNSTGILSADRFQSCGPDALAARTWLGTHLTALIGRERIEKTGLSLHEPGDGVVSLDLVSQPWNADFAVLSNRQREVMHQLNPSGVFGDYSSWRNCRGGPGWRPLPSPPRK